MLKSYCNKTALNKESEEGYIYYIYQTIIVSRVD